jgi:hypothetical protein
MSNHNVDIGFLHSSTYFSERLAKRLTKLTAAQAEIFRSLITPPNVNVLIRSAFGYATTVSLRELSGTTHAGQSISLRDRAV